jgi:hypothetical protein
MKKQIIEITNELKLGLLSTKQAKKQLLDLFGVSGSVCPVCEPDEIDILKCKHCGSTDIRGDYKHTWCGDCKKTYRGGV